MGLLDGAWIFFVNNDVIVAFFAAGEAFHD